MNKDLELKRTEIYKKYHINGMPNYARPKRKAIFFSPANSLEHELKKAEICYNLQKEGCEFIVEAVDNKTGLRRDVVCLDTGLVYEIETDKKRAERFKGQTNVKVIQLW